MRSGTAYPEAQTKVSAPFEDRPKYKSVDISHLISMASVLNIENLLRFKFCFGSNTFLGRFSEQNPLGNRTKQWDTASIGVP
jgi:hypothetical protein